MSTAWRDLRESFDQTIADPRCIALRGGVSDLRLVTLASTHRHGYGFQFRQFTSGDHRPDVVLRWAPWMSGNPRGSGTMEPELPGWTEPVFSYGRFGPDVIERGVRYVAAGLEMEEELLRTSEPLYLWSMEIMRQAYRPFQPRWREQDIELPWRLHLLIETRAPMMLSRIGGCIVLTSPDSTASLVLAVAADHAAWGGVQVLEEHDLAGRRIDLWQGPPAGDEACPWPRTGWAVPLHLRLLPEDSASVRLAIGIEADPVRVEAAVDQAAVERSRDVVAADWDAWLAHWGDGPRLLHLPDVEEQVAGLASRCPPPVYRDRHGVDRRQPQASSRPLPSIGSGDVTRAWSKCLALTRLCERLDPEWGRCLTETFTCYYSGTFSWSLPVIGWYVERHPQAERHGTMRDVLEAYLAMQADDGALPCYVSFGQPRPRQRPAHHPHTQQPQYAWAIWQEYRRTKDLTWLRRFVEPLVRFRDWMASRDRLGLGLWCQHHYYDGLDMFPTVDGLVLRGDPVLYSAAYAAEQVQYQRALARMLAELGDPRATEVQIAAEEAHRTMIQRLWDDDRHWFGDILADGQRETVVGMQGLFALAYGLAPAGADPGRLHDNLESLLAPFGVCTVAPSDQRFCERFFWRGPVWPASCLYGAAAARRYAPDLLLRIAAATTRFALAQPNIWECLEPHSGQVARYDEGHGVMPGLSSVVGSFAICIALEIAAGGDDPFRL